MDHAARRWPTRRAWCSLRGEPAAPCASAARRSSGRGGTAARLRPARPSASSTGAPLGTSTTRNPAAATSTSGGRLRSSALVHASRPAARPAGRPVAANREVLIAALEAPARARAVA